MRILLRLDEADCRSWLAGLSQALAAAGHEARFLVRRGAGLRDVSAGAAIALESRLFGAHAHGWSPLAPEALPLADAGFEAERRLELSESDTGAEFKLMLDGVPGIGAAARRLGSHHIPYVEIIGQDGTIAAAGLPAILTREVLVRALDDFTARLSTLILMAIDGKSRPAPRRDGPDPAVVALNPLAFSAGSIARKLARKVAPGLRKAEHWRVGVRAARPLAVEGELALDGYHWLPDDGGRYYADPFLFEEGGRDFLFVEEYPLATGRGIISVTELGPDGAALYPPRPIIEREGHVSYPILFREAGEIFMTLENAAEDQVPLYRARQFPDDWEEMKPLLAGAALHDATLFEHQGRWWLLANEQLGGGTSWDCLVIHHGPTRFGPFEAHPLNPILVDARDTRPGGAVLRVGERLIRPVQNCLIGYGKLLQFFEIEDLTPTSFRQRLVGRVLPPDGSGIEGAHTYSRNQRFEAIDGLFRV
jgi:hypothetical protein